MICARCSFLYLPDDQSPVAHWCIACYYAAIDDTRRLPDWLRREVVAVAGTGDV